MQNSVISPRITSLYWSQPSSVVFGCKTATFGSEKRVSMSPRHNLSFCACKTAWFAPEWQAYMGSSPHLCLFSCKTATVGPDWQVCMGPRPHLWLWVHNSVISTRIKRLYWFQPSPVVLCMQSNEFSTWKTSLYWSQPSSEVIASKPAIFGPKLHVSMGPRTHLWFSAC